MAVTLYTPEKSLISWGRPAKAEVGKIYIAPHVWNDRVKRTKLLKMLQKREWIHGFYEEEKEDLSEEVTESLLEKEISIHVSKDGEICFDLGSIPHLDSPYKSSDEGIGRRMPQRMDCNLVDFVLYDISARWDDTDDVFIFYTPIDSASPS